VLYQAGSVKIGRSSSVIILVLSRFAPFFAIIRMSLGGGANCRLFNLKNSLIHLFTRLRRTAFPIFLLTIKPRRWCCNPLGLTSSIKLLVVTRTPSFLTTRKSFCFRNRSFFLKDNSPTGSYVTVCT